ncbi:MAG: chemotaxis protein CheA [Myxococcales bacterium]|nr:chemotaxis protein CheA [Myxococcales bacterium]
MSELREEFLAEAQEIVEALSRDLLLLDQAHKDGTSTQDLINEVFRGVHTLKGIAGMFGYVRLGEVAHALEDLLDALRLGRREVSIGLLDALFEGVEVFQRLLVESPESPSSEVDLPAFLSRLASSESPGKRDAPDELAAYALDESVLAVLTEYEEHRLRTNVSKGMGLFRLRVRFSLMTIDTQLEDLKTRAKSVAEIITYLPSASGGDGDAIELDVVLASSAPFERLEEILGGDGAVLERVGRRPSRAPELAAPRPAARAQSTEHPAVILPPARPTSAPPAPSPTPRDVPAPRKELTADQLALRSVAHTVRVDIRKLDHLMNVVGELAIVRSAVTRLTEKLRGRPELRQLAIDLHRVNRGFERHLEELQDGILDVRMVPLGQTFDRLARIVRQLAREHDKEVQLVVSGAETEIDKLIVEELSDPLMHLIRNAIDHGIETPKRRELAGKPAMGTLVLNAYQKGNHVVIEIEDDGAGMNPQVIIETAISRGLVSEEAAAELSRDEALQLIFLPGFSTSAQVTDLSGRGVGMDVVKTNIARLGGVIDLHSELATGTKLTITLPVTLAIMSALLVRVGSREYALPITAVQEAIAFEERRVRNVEGREVLTLRGSTLPIARLDHLFRLPPAGAAKRFLVVASVGQKRAGLVVDALEGQQDIVIKPLGKSLSKVRGFAGATDLGDQRVALVLDAPGLLDEILAHERVLGEARR